MYMYVAAPFNVDWFNQWQGASHAQVTERSRDPAHSFKHLFSSFSASDCIYDEFVPRYVSMVNFLCFHPLFEYCTEVSKVTELPYSLV